MHIMRQGEYISDHEVKIANKVAEVLCGGNVTSGDAGERAVCAGSGARSLQVAVRGEEDAGTDSVHAEDGEDVEELSLTWRINESPRARRPRDSRQDAGATRKATQSRFGF